MSSRLAPGWSTAAPHGHLKLPPLRCDRGLRASPALIFELTESGHDPKLRANASSQDRERLKEQLSRLISVQMRREGSFGGPIGRSRCHIVDEHR